MCDAEATRLIKTVIVFIKDGKDRIRVEEIVYVQRDKLNTKSMSSGYVGNSELGKEYPEYPTHNYDLVLPFNSDLSSMHVNDVHNVGITTFPVY